MTGLLLVGLSMALAFAPPREPAPENDLRVAISLPKLNTASAETAADRKVAAVRPQPPQKPVVSVPLPSARGTEPAVHEAPALQLARVSPVEMPSLIDSASPEPTNPAFLDGLLASRGTHRGDSSMIRNWKLFGLPAFLAIALAADAQPAAAQFDGVLQAANQTTPPTNSDAPAAAQADQLKKLQASIEDLKKTSDDDLKALRDSLAVIRREMAELRDGRHTSDLSVQKAQGDLNDLKTQITQLQKDVDDLRRRAQPPANTIAGYAGAPLGAPQGAPPAGRIRLINSYFMPETVRVNDRTFLLQPNEERMLEGVPTGTFTYEVIGVTDPRVRTLAASDVFTINVHPRG
jgi:hypothetical protein